MQHSIANMNNTNILIAPSILAANFAKLGDEIARIEDAGANIVHIDVMDGHFVPNISMGPPVVKSIRNITKLPFDVHLMITNPIDYISPFADAGADLITFHIEAEGDPMKTICEIRNAGCEVGISLKPKTPASLILPFLDKVDLVLVMSVEPGFGGQSFMHNMMPKVCEIRNAINAKNLPVHLEIDGGIDENTAKTAVDSGVNIMVAGTSVFRHPKGAKFAIEALKSAQIKI